MICLVLHIYNIYFYRFPYKFFLFDSNFNWKLSYQNCPYILFSYEYSHERISNNYLVMLYYFLLCWWWISVYCLRIFLIGRDNGTNGFLGWLLHRAITTSLYLGDVSLQFEVTVNLDKSGQFRLTPLCFHDLLVTYLPVILFRFQEPNIIGDIGLIL